MSTEQEISGAEREALKKAFEGWTPFSDLPMADLAWVAARDYYKAQFLEQNGKLGAATAAIQRERDEAEQRADMAEGELRELRDSISTGVVSVETLRAAEAEGNMAEEREKKLREALGLARSMVLCGERMSPEAEHVIESALHA